MYLKKEVVFQPFSLEFDPTFTLMKKNIAGDLCPVYGTHKIKCLYISLVQFTMTYGLANIKIPKLYLVTFFTSQP